MLMQELLRCDCSAGTGTPETLAGLRECGSDGSLTGPTSETTDREEAAKQYQNLAAK